MKKIFLKSVIISFFFLFFFPSPIKAGGEFSLKANSEYKIEKDGKAFVTNVLQIKNLTSRYLAKGIEFFLSGNAINNIKIYESGEEIDFSSETKEDSTKILINFKNPDVGLNNTKTILITFELEDIAKKLGNTWEVSIPKLSDKNFDEYKLTLIVPEEFGGEAFIYPEPTEARKEEKGKIFIFQKDDFENSGIKAVFGESQSYNFKIGFSLYNPHLLPKSFEIPIPPDTARQKVFLEKIEPIPRNIRVDTNGNWLANFNLLPKQKIEVDVEGFVQIFPNPIKLLSTNPKTLLSNLNSTKIWQSDDPEIKKLAGELESIKDIYKFVIEKLNYDYERVDANNQRKGAKKALENPDNSICTEYTDLFIALARSKGIPSREIIGYAESTDEILQPISLLEKRLHSWPEYWDSQSNNWIAVDPTWEDTSKRDFFNKFDMNHITFIINGENASEIYPNSISTFPLPQKVSITHQDKLPSQKKLSLNIEAKNIFSFPFFKKNIKVRINNKGNEAFYNILASARFGEVNKEESLIEVLPPFSTYSFPLPLPTQFFLGKPVEQIIIKAGHEEKVIQINKSEVLLKFIAIFLTFLSIITSLIVYKTKLVKDYEGGKNT